MAKDNTSKGMIFSTVIHVAFFALLLVFILMENLQSEPEPIVLELVSPPSPQSQQDAPAAPRLPNIAAPAVEQIREVEIPDIPEPQAPPPPQPPPPPAPTPAPPKPQQPKPKPKPPEPQYERVSADDFFKDRERPPQTVTRATQRSVPSPQLKIDDLTASLNNLLQDNSASQSSASEQRALMAYIGRLRQQIEINWHKPDLATANNEWVEVVITVQANGKISGFKITRKNAGTEMVRSVERAVNSARSVGPTPNGKTLPVQFTLRLREE